MSKAAFEGSGGLAEIFVILVASNSVAQETVFNDGAMKECSEYEMTS